MPSRMSLIFCAVLLFCFVCAGFSGQQTGTPASTSKPEKPTSGAQAAPSAKGASTQGASSAALTTKPPAAEAKEDISVTAWKMLEAGVASDKTRTRSDALSALTILNADAKAISLMKTLLQDKEDSIRVLAATSLGDIKARSAIPELRKALDDPSVQVNFAAAQALWKMGDRTGRDIFYAVLDGERKTGPGLIQTKVRTAKQDMHDPKALALIGINEASGAFLGPFSMGISMIEEYAKNTSAPVQAVCAQMLAMDDSQRTTQELEDALWDKNWAVRAAAARGLVKLKDRKALKQLTDMMGNDKQESARLVAAAAILQLRGGRSTDAHHAKPALNPESPAKDEAIKPL